MKPTIREVLQAGVLAERENAAKTTKFDNQLKVTRGGDSISIPHTVRPEKAVSVINAWAKAESQVVAVTETIPGIPIDVAHALMLAVEHEFGQAERQPVYTFFGVNPPPYFSVPINTAGDTTNVYVGTFTLPGLEEAEFNSYPAQGAMALSISGSLRQKDLPLFQQLMATTRQMLMEKSIYKGKAITINFADAIPDNQGRSKMVIPAFWDVAGEKPLILSRESEAMINATIWTPIVNRDLVKKMGTPIKRGVLLYGKFGTGKTLTAYRTAQLCVEHGYTFLYVRDVAFLKQAIEFCSAHYLPAVLFMEDTEKAFEDPARINEIQNTMDGIDGKSRDLIVILTTNYVERLPAAIMRPGRLDTVISLKNSDPETAGRLVKLYAGDMLDEKSNMDIIGEAVRGQIPAAVREVVERAKLYALARVKSIEFKINHEDIVMSAKGMEEHMALLAGNSPIHKSPTAVFGEAVGTQLASGLVEAASVLVTGKAVGQ